MEHRLCDSFHTTKNQIGSSIAMEDVKVATAADAQAEKKTGRKKSDVIHIGDSTTGEVFKKKSAIEKRWLDMFGYLNPAEVVDGKKVIFVNLADPLEGRPLCPGKASALCAQCAMDTMGSRHPYIEPYGSENPLVTIITEGITNSQDDKGRQIVPANERVHGANSIYRLLASKMDETGVDPDTDVRWLTATRCACRGGKRPNLSTKAQWCRYHIVQDLRLHTPKMIMPFGTVPLGALSHKSNAGDWQGKILTYRGWPDDWLTERKFMLPRPSMRGDDSTMVGHPLFGPLTESRTLLYPLQSPYLIIKDQNPRLREQWENAIFRGLELAKTGVEPLNYVLPHYHITTDPEEVKAYMLHLAEDIPGTVVSFDTETTGLKAYAKGQKIVFMMFRWDDPETGEPRSIGFPWDFPESDLANCVDDLTPYVLNALYASTLAGHNITFDAKFVAATLKGCDINRLAPNCKYDTWHMAYTSKSSRGRYGLERITYDYAPHLAGYEEDMTLLIDLHSDLLSPEEGGHYAKCPKEKWETHLKPYVMGDVETVHCARQEIAAKLATRKTYGIPIADPNDHGRFRTFTPPSRAWLYESIISPASRMLIKVMARGMHVDASMVKLFESKYPASLLELKTDISTKYPQIAEWVAQKEAMPREDGDNKEWEFDLDNKEVLRDLLFGHLELPIQRLTKAGRVIYPEPEDVENATRAEQLKYAAVDKFTLNKLAADHEIARPLLQYRKLYKLYTTYVRPLLNCYNPEIDKKRRDKEPHLWLPGDGGDGCLHADFLLTGTRGGRLCIAGETVLSVRVGLPTNSLVNIEVKDLWKFANVPLYVKTDKSRWKKIKTVYFKGYEEMFQVCAGSSAKVKATKGHRLKTDVGWKSVGEIRVGDRVQVDLLQGCWTGANGGELCRPGDQKGMEFRRDVENNHQESHGAESETLHAEVPGATNSAFLSEICRTPDGQQERVQTAISDFSATRISGACEKGVRRMAAFTGTQYIGVFSKEELTILRNKIEQEDSSVQRSSTSETTDDGTGQGLSWVERNAHRVFTRASGIPIESVSSISQMSDGCLVFEGHLPESFQVCHRKIEVAVGGDFVVRPSSRGRVVGGVAECRNTVLSGIHDTKLQQSPSRLCLDRHEPADRDRRRVPQEVGRRETRFGLGRDGLQSDSVYGGTGSAQNGFCLEVYPEPCFNAVTSIESCGTQGVWDIEVEDDASYVAQGLVHHNSCRDPNLQQLPSDSDIKKMLKSRFGKRGCMYAGDLSQIELRLLAAACGDPNMLKAYHDDLDLHTLTTSRIFKLPYETFSKEYMAKLQESGKGDEAKSLNLKRRIGKTCNFLTGYGGGAFGLQTTLANSQIYLSLEECEDILESFFESYPVLRRYLGEYKEFILETGVAVSLFGRVRLFDEVDSNDNELRSKALRAGCNHLIQATASDMMLICLCAIEDVMREENLESMLVSTVHDSLVIDAVQDELPIVHSIVYSVLNNIPEIIKMTFGDTFDTSWMIVPFAGDCEVGMNYKDMSSIPTKGNIDWQKILSAA